MRSLILPAVLSLLAGCAGTRGLQVGGPAGHPGRAMIGSCKGRLDLVDRRIRFRADYVLHAPDRLYLEVSGAVGSVRAIMVVDGSRLAVLFPHEKRYLREPATEETFERLLGFPLPASALLDLLGFQAPDGPLPGATGRFIVSREDSRMIVEPMPGSQGRLLRLELRPESIEPVAVSSLRPDQFEPVVPDGWSRLTLDPAAGDPPLLMP